MDRAASPMHRRCIARCGSRCSPRRRRRCIANVADASARTRAYRSAALQNGRGARGSTRQH
eukprot:4031302-Pyramimonas_sp.AAC.1